MQNDNKLAPIPLQDENWRKLGDVTAKIIKDLEKKRPAK